MRDEIKKLTGIYAAIATMMCIMIPMSILADITEAFPNVPTTTVQMIIALPSLFAMLGNFIIARFAPYISKRYMVIGCTCLYIVVGVIPFFFHQSVAILLIVAAVEGIAMGGVQNASCALICDYFEGDARGGVMGLCSVFVGLGGSVFTACATRLGMIGWHYAYLTYLVLIPFLLLELLFLPKGILEEKQTKTNKIQIPPQIIMLCIFGFITFTYTQTYNTNVALLIKESGFGSTMESGIASSVYQITLLIGGILVIPMMKIFKRQTLSVDMLICAAGCLLMAAAPGFLVICIGGVLISFAYAVFSPVENDTGSRYCGSTGLAFNLALMTATQSLGSALSPYTTSLIAAPFGGDIRSIYACGAVILAVMSVIACLTFRKLLIK